jgi:hypothetical protein
MTVVLDRIDSVPILNSDTDTQLLQWFWVLVDTLNENLSDIQDAIMSVNITPSDVIAQNVDVNSRNIPTGAALTVYQLPDTFEAGERVTVAGQGAGGWRLLTGSGQTIQISSVPATANTSVSSANRYDSIELIGVLANTTWISLSTQTTGFAIV